MGLQQQQVVMVLADISGYTRFMTSNQKSLAHSQIVISELINTLLKEVAVPLNLVKLEGDAIFLYAAKTGSEAEWSDNRHKIAERLLTFFKVFSHKVSELTMHSICTCGACTNIDRLRLKVVAHTGVAVFQHMGNMIDLFGVDVIAVHRLLKNSVNADEYILLSESAQHDIPLPGLKSWESQETYDELGTIKTYVYLAPEPPPYMPDLNAKSNYNALFIDTLRDEVQKEYAEVALHPEKGFHFHTGRKLATLLNYKDEWLEGIPERSIESFAGTGNPFSVGLLKPGERVIDIGCGAGIDSLIASRMVGPSGQVVGVDMTSPMLEKSRASAADMQLVNVEFRQGYAEKIPIENGWADVVISNGVINLCPDKSLAFQEMFRVLKPNGRLQIGDILVQKVVPESAKRNIDLWTG